MQFHQQRDHVDHRSQKLKFRGLPASSHWKKNENGTYPWSNITPATSFTNAWASHTSSTNSVHSPESDYSSYIAIRNHQHEPVSKCTESKFCTNTTSSWLRQGKHRNWRSTGYFWPRYCQHSTGYRSTEWRNHDVPDHQKIENFTWKHSFRTNGHQENLTKNTNVIPRMQNWRKYNNKYQ